MFRAWLCRANPVAEHRCAWSPLVLVPNDWSVRVRLGFIGVRLVEGRLLFRCSPMKCAGMDTRLRTARGVPGTRWRSNGTGRQREYFTYRFDPPPGPDMRLGRHRTPRERARSDLSRGTRLAHSQSGGIEQPPQPTPHPWKRLGKILTKETA